MKLSATEVKIKLLKLSKKNFSAWRKLRTIFRKAFYANIHHFHFPSLVSFTRKIRKSRFSFHKRSHSKEMINYDWEMEIIFEDKISWYRIAISIKKMFSLFFAQRIFFCNFCLHDLRKIQKGNKIELITPIAVEG